MLLTKTKLFPGLIVLLIFSVGCKSYFLFVEKQKLIKSIESRYYIAEIDEAGNHVWKPAVVNGDTIKYLSYFNKNSECTQDFTLKTNGSLVSQNKSVYVKGLLMQAFHFDSNSKLTSTIEYLYNEKGYSIGEVQNSETGDSYRSETKYDSIGNVIEQVQYFPLDKVTARHVFSYDEKQNLTTQYRYGEKDSLYWKIDYRYDSTGNVVEENTYSPADFLSSKLVYSYDVKGQEKCLGYDSQGKLFSVEILDYLEDCTLIKEYTKSYDDETVIRTYSYKYDKHGNWIETLEIKNNQPNSLTKRKIVYY